MSQSRDRVINKLPPPHTTDAAPHGSLNFHIKTKEACAVGDTGNVGLKVSKVIVVGDVAVGKTSLVNRYCHNIFDRDYKATIGVDFEVERFEILGQEFNMQIWDTAGQERFKCMASAYYRSAHVIVVMFDLTQVKTLVNARQWLDEAMAENQSSCPEVFLVGTKMDLCKRSSLEEMERSGITLAQEINAEYWSLSSKTGENVNAFFSRVAALTFEQAVLRELDAQNRRQPLNSTKIGNGGIVRVQQQTKEEKETQKHFSRNCCGGRAF